MVKMNKSEINYYDCSEGDSNDCYRRFILKGTDRQVDQYLKDTIEEYYDKSEYEEINADPYGYGVSNEFGFEYFVDCSPIFDKSEIQEIESYSIEEYNKRFFYHKIIDLTENMEVLNQ